MRKIFAVILYEFKDIYESGYFTYLSFIFFFNIVASTLILESYMVLIFNLISTMILFSYENRKNYYNNLMLSITKIEFIASRYFFFNLINIFLLIVFTPIFAIFMNIDLFIIFRLFLIGLIIGSISSAILTLLLVVKLKNMAVYRFFIALLLPIFIPFLLISNSILINQDYGKLSLILFSLGAIINFAILYLSVILIKE